MFLMNAPPVLALQSAWEAFGRPGGCRFPGRFSEPESAGRAAVSARVQMVISTLQGDRAARGRSQERALHRGPRGREAQPATSLTSAACGHAADSGPRREEDSADVGPPVLDSDSDDSVDRDIEEAIQEYLKARSGATQPTAASGDSPPKPEPPQSSAPPAWCPPRLTPGSGGAPGSRVGASEAPGSASPLSVSSEDSFEQSIRAEIEQFLSEKRQHEPPKQDAPADKKTDPGDTSSKPALRSCKEPGVKAPRQELAGACREFVFRKPPRLAKAPAQPRSLRSRATTEPESLGSPKPAAPRPPAACRTVEAQSKGGAKRSPGPGRRGQGARSSALVREASDSSSDDGIEEAIQLYQLEKRKEASGDPPGEGPPEPPARSTSHATKSALPETHRKTLGKKKPVASKAVDLGPGGPDRPSKPPKETKVPAAPGHAAAKSELADGPSCRADTSTELMCAEAILDISKTILPAPGEGGDRPLSTSPLPRPPSVPSHSDGDSSSVDSDDSIEREIRTFLALKAQSGTLLARTDPCPHTVQSPLPPPGPHGQAGGPKAPASRTLEVSPSRKRKRRGGSTTMWSPTPRKASEVAKEGAPDSDPGPARASEAPGREGEAQLPPCRTVGLGGEHVALDMRGGMSPSPGKAVESRSPDEKGSSEDKSSSLDSDEDLDTAIKDLLRSKRRLKKRCRDPRAACRKKVRFSTTEARAAGQQGGLQQGWRERGPHPLKSCLSKARQDGKEDPRRKPSGVSCCGTERTEPGGSTGPADTPLALAPGRRARRGRGCSGEAEAGPLHGSAAGPGPQSEDSSSVDSDDSIELEIRRFLAEKAKESVSGLEVQGGSPTTLGPASVARPEPPGRKAAVPALALQPGVCTRSQRGRGTPQPAAGPRGGPHAEQACLPAALSRGQQAPPRSTSETVPARGPPAGRRSLYPHRDRSARGAGPTAGDSAVGQPSSCAEAGAGAGSLSGTLLVTSRSRSALTRSLGADREGGPQASPALPWGDFTHQSRLQSTWALSSEGRDAAWRGGLGSEKEKVVEGQARGSPSLTTDPKRGLPFTGFSPLRSTQLFHFGNSVAWGGKPTSLFSPGLGLPLQGPSFSAFREAPAGPSPVFGSSHLLGRKEGGHWPRRKAPATLGFRDSRNLGLDEDVLDLRYGQGPGRDLAKDQEAWGSDASELSDTSVEDGGPVAPGKALKL
ncbi:protein phosphatase 1 regulatory subunit 26 [Sturnira hondurensis]|uniref:protein phosphatase 1 regulatory subunit 26 n=1 Tax=Sturnira hondurensis TaxID=192404 RepID=UPI00187AEBA3|nr:protein phosphatase 1 regulatory subunit 26 [Sturnira hondurensis]XP_036892437.1 protein phosphatase 1 regulatory subunit 26 [Sturnira hondurensis]XP_036892438.1 protein phosphatase 1 regulatory subunit 26 [Sturnira hondurensis]XP_036892439.1 protein phosphatase 1 regulatory subunit 26 [Sturnira hondurensis]XP_036892440.1 protein phosphatase 1 regulatory subunit 26 [Sturnira hondurensis]XP_036892442.1 protein phosphatase 1 regulatory subunit 26 [Sturnira hondurensis]XP_036892443.1 protein 